MKQRLRVIHATGRRTIRIFIRDCDQPKNLIMIHYNFRLIVEGFPIPGSFYGEISPMITAIYLVAGSFSTVA
jgi:hypothetical protein